MTREEAIAELKYIAKSKMVDYTEGYAAIFMAIEALSAEDEGANLINRHDAVTVIREECWKCNNMINDDLFMRIMSLPTSRQTDCTEFIMWLVEVVLDDEDWELNAVSYGEVIARKLKKLGLLEVKDGYYIRHIENNTKESDLVYRPSAEAVHKPDYSYEADMVRRMKEALSAETSQDLAKPNKALKGSDLISRQDAIDAVLKRREETRGAWYGGMSEAVDVIDALPSAEAVQGWIPCSERLPDVGEDVLLQFRVAQCVGNRCLDYDDNGWVINSGGEWQTPILDGDEEPIAWMPLPTPYKGGEDE